MKKIANRLILQSVVLLLVFACIIAVFFGVLFAKQTEDLHQEEMLHRSELISTTMADYFESNSSAMMGQGHGQNSGMGGYGAFLRFLNQIAGEEVWVLDENLDPIIDYHHQAAATTTELPKEAQELVATTYENGETNVRKERRLFQLQELTIATPIFSEDTLAGVVVMHSKVSAIHQNQLSGYLLLVISLVGAIIIASLFAWRLAKRFVQPISQMKDYVNDLAKEDFQQQLDIHTQDELQELGDQLSLLSHRLSEAQQARLKKQQSEKDFLSQISHELRTPVMVIKSSLEAINDNTLDREEEREYLQHLLLESHGLERLINDLLELSRLESTEFQLQKEPLDLLDCINDALRGYRVPLKDKQQQVVFTNELTEKQLINGDYLRITQTLKILLDNANTYAPVGSTIDLYLRKTETALELTMKNSTGSQQIIDTQHLFELFSRGTHSSMDGTGLGLAIARHVILRHSGEITATAEAGQFILKIILPFL